MNRPAIRLMTHVVAGYPTRDDCLSLMKQMSNLGVYGIEVQIPFSDPIADGSVIVEANSHALHNHITTDDVFRMLSQFKQSGYKTPVFLMSYANKVRHYGYERFCEAALACGVQGIIVPDLPLGTDEYRQFREQLNSNGINLIPVLSPGMGVARLEDHLVEGPKMVYVTSTRGITGGQLQITKAFSSLIAAIRAKSDTKIVVGFGIRSAKDIRSLQNYSDVAVIGSALIKEVQLGGVKRAVTSLGDIVKSIR